MRVATHGGKQHADEAMGLAVLETALGHKLEVVRGAPLEELDAFDFVLDMGGVYDPLTGRFDHHSGVEGLRRQNGIPYATAGLVWKEYGLAVSGKVLRSCPKIQATLERFGGGTEEVFKYLERDAMSLVDRVLMQPLDAWDNGIYPTMKGASKAIAMQSLVPYLDFRVLVDALAKLVEHVIRTWGRNHVVQEMLRLAASGQLEGVLEFLEVPGCLDEWGQPMWLVVCQEDSWVHLNTAGKTFDEYGLGSLLGVLTTLRENSRWGLHLTRGVTKSRRVPKNVEHNSMRNKFFASAPEVLREWALGLRLEDLIDASEDHLSRWGS